ncbi:MAG TPA: lytic transglycosylase domain-containing protein [Acetobacteraceae bacterium]|nr:lytic transglycosylase domain-containing protein [Acetobacteraceae bacterium]
MWRFCVAIAFGLAFGNPGQAEIAVAPAVAQGMLCRSAVAAAERGNGIPAHLLAAIARVESGRRDPATGATHPWPWAANAEGQGFFFETKAEAVASVRAMQARGIRSIDVGCSQVNLMHHPDAFASLEQAFDPTTNTAYAGRFLKGLFGQTGDWNKAAAAYHSATPELGAEYQRKVLAVWPEEQRLAGLVSPTPLAQAWNATMAAPPVGFMRVMRMQPTGMSAGPKMIMLSGPGGEAPPGRNLDAYRAAPIGLGYQAPPRRIGG